MLTEHQHKLRKQHIGASESPAICGLSPWKTAADIYWAKVSDDKPEDEATEAMETGNRLEDALIEYAQQECGLSGIRRNQFRVSKEEPILAATCDAVGDNCVIEAKTSSYRDGWGDPFTDQVPDYVLVQVQHQLFVTESEIGYVPVLLAGPRFEWRVYRIPRYDELITAIVQRCVEFWRQHIEPKIPPTDEPPPLSYLRSRSRESKSIILPEEAGLLVTKYQDLNQQIKALEEQKEAMQRTLIALLEDADEGVLPDGTRVTYRQYVRKNIDVTELRKKYPQIAEELTKVSEYRMFRIGQVKTGGQKDVE